MQGIQIRTSRYSQAQATCVRVNPHTLVPTGISFLQCDIELRSPDRHDAAIATAGLLFCFRAHRAELRTISGKAVNIWCVYKCHNYEQVPATWRATANHIGRYDNPYLRLLVSSQSLRIRSRNLRARSSRAAEAHAQLRTIVLPGPAGTSRLR